LLDSITSTDDFIAGVAACVPAMQARAAGYDAASAFPHEDFVQLRQMGLLTATLPPELGGAGFGLGPQGAKNLAALLALLGEGSLAVARLYEAHVNALQLALRYGSHRLAETVARDAREGRLFALWVTDPADGGVRLTSARTLTGRKIFCSGAGAADRALITVGTPEGTRMMIVRAPGADVVKPAGVKLAGMRAAITGAVDFTGYAVNLDDWLGGAGDYLREPVFSAGAWRGSAAAYGGLVALLKLYRDELVSRGRNGHPHQLARFGSAVIAAETARLWLHNVALRACLEDGPAEEIVAYVNLGRIAIETACLDAIRLTQRSLGLGAFMEGAAAERIARDLAVFLRQPAPDETLERGATYYFQNELPA